MIAAVGRFIDHYRAPRVLGLDLLRIWASLTIVAFHGSTFHHRDLLLGHGWLAVDVFFVLSGWLLTRQAIRLYQGGRSPLAFAAGFWTRRWFRILPAYWAILLLVSLIGAVLPLAMGLTPQGLPRHLLFLQTVFLPNFYGVTWSLVAEEGFYLLLPFAIVIFAILRRRSLIAVCLVAIFLVPVTGRVLELRTTDAFTLLQVPQVRFDGLVVGAALGAVWSLLPQWKARLLRERIGLFTIGCVGFLSLYMLAPDNYLFDTLGLVAVSLMVGLMIPQLTLLSWPAAVPATLPLLITFLSDLTYSLYLFHPLGYRLVDLLGITSKIGYFAVALPVILTGAILLHVLIERPFLAWRARVGAGSRLADGAVQQMPPRELSLTA